MVKICFAPQLATIYYPEKNTRRINVVSYQGQLKDEDITEIIEYLKKVK